MAKKNQADGGAELSASPSTAGEFAAAYFEGNQNSLLESVYVASDGTIFPGGAKGKNAADNYADLMSKTSTPVQITEVSRY